MCNTNNLSPTPEEMSKNTNNNQAIEKKGEASKKEEKDSADSKTEANGSAEWDKIYESFQDMGLKKKLLRGIYAFGFEKPSAIQSRAIVPTMRGHDIIAQAQSGTGKTGTFTIAALQRIDPKIKSPQVIVLAPVRELARQSKTVAMALGDYLDISVHLCIGGTRTRDDYDAFRAGVHMVVGTPGRIRHMMDNGAIKMKHLKTIILDEADEMLKMGFEEQICDIFEMLPKNVQKCLFSATMPNEALEITENFMEDPVRILVKKEEVTLEGIEQYYIPVGHERFKLETLMDLYETISVNQSIIFLNTRSKVEEVANALQAEDFSVSAIHGDMTDEDRKSTVKEFRHGKSRVLLATDVLARGIDFQNLNLVVCYDLPSDKANYIHRIGRCGRFGRKGASINFVTDRDVGMFRELERYYRTQIRELPADFVTKFG